jgi:hypothetical protein
MVLVECGLDEDAGDDRGRNADIDSGGHGGKRELEVGGWMDGKAAG